MRLLQVYLLQGLILLGACSALAAGTSESSTEPTREELLPKGVLTLAAPIDSAAVKSKGDWSIAKPLDNRAVDVIDLTNARVGGGGADGGGGDPSKAWRKYLALVNGDLGNMNYSSPRNQNEMTHDIQHWVIAGYLQAQVKAFLLQNPAKRLKSSRSRQIIQDILNRGVLEDVRAAKLRAESECIDKHNLPHEFSTRTALPGQAFVGAAICYSPELIAARFDTSNSSPLNLNRFLVGILVHEYARHFGYEDPDLSLAIDVAVAMTKPLKVTFTTDNGASEASDGTFWFRHPRSMSEVYFNNPEYTTHAKDKANFLRGSALAAGLFLTGAPLIGAAAVMVLQKAFNAKNFPSLYIRVIASEATRACRVPFTFGVRDAWYDIPVNKTKRVTLKKLRTPQFQLLKNDNELAQFAAVDFSTGACGPEVEVKIFDNLHVPLFNRKLTLGEALPRFKVYGNYIAGDRPSL